MAEIDFNLEAAPILDGADLTIGANRIVERDDLALVSVATPLGGEEALARALNKEWGLSLPEANIAAQSGDTRAMRTGTDQILLIFSHKTPDAETVVRQKLAGAGYTTDQTDVWVLLEINGPDTVSALERICPLDAAQFPSGGAARTVMEHMGAIIMRLDEDRFLLMSASSSAASFLHAIETSYRNTAA